MRNRGGLLRRNSRMIALFGLLVIIPVAVSGILMVRALRGDRIRTAFQRTERQRSIVRQLDTDLTRWLFSMSPASARAIALLHFQAVDERIDFPAFQLSLSDRDAPEQRPFDTGPPHVPLTAKAVTEQFFPRIQAFRRDAAAGRNSGAQYFPRLASLVIQPATAHEGYVVDVNTVLEHANARLSAFTATEPFTASAWIAAQRPSRRPSEALGLESFPFFEVVFEDRPVLTAVWTRDLVPYSLGALVLVTVLGSAFMFRAIAHETRLARLRSDFVAAVSHEFRSPLASILALSERLDRVTDETKRREYSAIIGDDARRLSALVTRLLDFGLMEEGQRLYAAERIDLADVARTAVRSCSHVTRRNRIEVAGAAPEGLLIRGDRVALAHAVQNLIDNAAKYSPADTAVTVHWGSADGCHHVDVQDRGIGIPPSEQARIFEKFYRGTQAADLNAEGVGIGLALVRHIVERHGGSIVVASTPGRGSRFSLRFPRADA